MRKSLFTAIFLLTLVLLGSALPVMAQVTSIRAIQNNPSAYTTVTIEGVVTLGAGVLDTVRLKAYVQDTSGYGIQIFAPGLSPMDYATYIRGQRVRIQGSVSIYNGAHGSFAEIISATATTLGETPLPTPPPITVSASRDTIRWEGAYFEVQGRITRISDLGWAKLADLTDASGTLTIKLPSTAHLAADIVATGSSYRIRGVGETYDAEMEIDLCYAEDVIAVADTDTTSPGDVIPIRDIQRNPAAYGSVTIEGIVTIGANLLDSTRLKAYVQDSTGYGIQIFGFSMTSTDLANYVRGNRVRVTGTVSNYMGTHGATTEISSATATLLGTGTLPTAPSITVSATLADTLHYEGAFFEIQGTIGSIYDAGFARLIDLTDAASQVITVKIPSTAHLASDILVTGQTYRVRGVGESYDGIELDLCYAADVTPGDTTHPTTVTPIRSIQQNPAAYGTVTIEGIVTAGVGVLDTARLKAYVQDSTGYGIQIFGFSITSGDRANYVRGNRVRVTGTVSNYMGTHGAATEISSAATTLLGTASVPSAPRLTSFIGVDTIRYEGAYFEVRGHVTWDSTFSFARLANIDDGAGHTITVKIPNTAGLPTTIVRTGTDVRVRGIGEAYDAEIEVNLLYAEDFTLGAVEGSTYEAGLGLSPNPFTTSCRFAMPLLAPAEIVDLSGRVIETLPPGTMEWTPGAALPQGTYFIRSRGVTLRAVHVK